MFLMDPLSKIFLYLFLVTSMLGVGLQTSVMDMRSLLESKGLLLRLLAANFIVVPIIGIAMARMMNLSPEVATALILLACTPGGVSAVQFTSKIKSSLAFAGGAAVTLSFLSMIISPLLLMFVLPSATAGLPYGRIFLNIAVLLLLPLAVGMLVRFKWEELASRLAKPFAIIGTISFLVVLILLMNIRKQAMHEIGSTAVIAMLLFIVLSMATGWFLGGPDRETRQISATASSMRFAALCLVIALNSFPGPEIYTPLIAFSALMIPPNLLFTIFYIIQKKRRSKKSTT
jgi:BASS family bile acid:Na+ symporter